MTTIIVLLFNGTLFAYCNAVRYHQFKIIKHLLDLILLHLGNHDEFYEVLRRIVYAEHYRFSSVEVPFLSY